MHKRKNKKQKAWEKAFLSVHKSAKIISCKDATCGYYYYLINWQEVVDLSKYSGYDSGSAYYIHQTNVELTPSAKTRNVKDEIIEVVYPHCSAHFPKINTTGQLALGEPIYIMPSPKLKPKVNFHSIKRSQKKFRKLPGQLDLPLFGLPALLHRLRSHQGQVFSSQALLAEKVWFYVDDLNETLYIPQALIDVLNSVNATPNERAIAMRMLLTCGEIGALDYALSIETWRTINARNLRGS